MKKVKPNLTMNDANISGSITPTIPYFGDDFSLQDFVDPPLNFDQVIEMIRGEANDPISSIGDNAQNFDAHIFTNKNVVQDNQQYNLTCAAAVPRDVFTSFNSPRMSCTNNFLMNSFSGIDDDMINGAGNEDEDDDDFGDGEGEGEQSSANNSTERPKKGKADRSRTLISERRRRGRMKEKLYALRALVPNITKMDKASIVGDAVLYLQDLQMQAKKLRSQIQGLESSYETAARSQAFIDTPKKTVQTPVSKIIMQVDVVQIEDREFYVKVMSNKGQGVAASLYRALGSLSSFIIQSSNLTSLCDQFVLTFTIHVGKCMDDFSLANLRLWISGALLNQGFEFRPFQRA